MSSSPIRVFRKLIATATISAMACATAPVYDPPPVTGAETAEPAIQAHYRAYRAEGERNSVLNLMRLAVAAMDAGRIETAESALEQIIVRIGASDAGSPEARRARSLWNAESEKRFKGETHERAMVYYYRGLLYLSAGDYDNARASFRAGQLEDSMAESPDQSQNFSSLYLLSGWASHCMGDSLDAEEAWAEMRRVEPDSPVPTVDSNLLVVVETGSGPRKAAGGLENSSLEYEGGVDVAKPYGAVDHEPLEIHPMDDLLAQATGRGKREVEQILAAHGRVKRVNREIGEALTATGATAAIVSSQQNSPEAALVSLGVMLFGLAQQGVAAQMRAEADTRTWDNLPGRISIGLAAARPGLRSLVVSDHGASVSVPPDGCALLWARSDDGARWSTQTLGRSVAALR